MAYSYVEYVGDGSTKTFNIPFTYLDQADIQVFVGGVETPVTYTSASVVTLATAPASGVTVRIKRTTEADARLVDFQDGSTLTEELLDLDSNQTFFLVQESIDRSDVVIAKAQEAIDAKNLAKTYAEWAYKYERLAFNHMEDASDFKDQAQIFKELAESAAAQTKTAAITTETARAEVAVNRGLVETAKNDVLIAKGLVDSQANLASVILTNAQTAATQAQTVAQNALNTATTVQGIATDLEATVKTVAAQQAAALSAKTAAETARDAAITAKTTAENAAGTATTQAGIATTKAGEAATAASTATTQAGIATTKAGEASTSAASAATAKTAAEAARDAAQASAASIDVSNKADLTYVNTQLATKANSSSLATVATTGSYNDLSNKPTIPTVPTTVSSFTNDAGYLTSYTETDPVFVASAAYSITGTDKTNWNTAYGWGNHASAGYLTTSSASSTYLALAGGALTGGLREAKVAMAANDISLSAGNYFTKTISTATTLTVSNVPTTGTAASFILDLTNGGAGTITWWTGMKWAGGTAPTLTASGRDVLGFFTHDGGTTWTGLVLGKDVK